MSDKQQVVKAGIPWAFLLTVLFLVLKVSGTVTWPWWLVLFPLWFGPAVALVVLGVLGIFGIIALLIAAFVSK